MSATKDVIAGMQILMSYYDKPDGYHTGAKHDTLYMYATDRPVSEEDRTKLEALGWHQEGAEDAEDKGGLPSYDEDEGWYTFV